ncbi:MAG: PepSY-like domain-containing protein [Bacteroidales bacterium]|jgi:hypothetical protein|nr:PepSY-like domain-containing protein [Bacteroidales bacterium]
MKFTRFLLTALLALSTAALCFADDRPIPVEQLPAAAKAFVQEHFPENAIVYAKMDVEMQKTEYEARLNDGSKVEFDEQGNWKEVNCHYKAVPAVLVPKAIADYVQAKFPDIAITKISRKWYGFEVELLSDLDLRFDKDGAFIGFDD